MTRQVSSVHCNIIMKRIEVFRQIKALTYLRKMWRELFGTREYISEMQTHTNPKTGTNEGCFMLKNDLA